jgi:hypothetical protein
MQLRRIAIATVIVAALTPGAALAASKVGGGNGTAGASHVTLPPPVSYVESYSSGEPGSASDQTCDKLAGAANNDYDTAQTLLDGGDNPSTWALLNTVKALQDYAENIGCVVINPYDV